MKYTIWTQQGEHFLQKISGDGSRSAVVGKSMWRHLLVLAINTIILQKSQQFQTQPLKVNLLFILVLPCTFYVGDGALEWCHLDPATGYAFFIGYFDHF